MSNPNQAYVSSGVVIGGFSTTLYRPTDATLPTGPATNSTSLGTYLVESLTPNYNGILINRPAVDGGDNGFVLINGIIEGSARIQIATGTTPSPRNGDFFVVADASIDAVSNGAAVSRQFVLHSVQPEISTNSYRVISCSVRVDKNPQP